MVTASRGMKAVKSAEPIGGSNRNLPKTDNKMENGVYGKRAFGYSGTGLAIQRPVLGGNWQERLGGSFSRSWWVNVHATFSSRGAVTQAPEQTGKFSP